MSDEFFAKGLKMMAEAGFPVALPPRPLPVLDHDHEWVDTTVLENDERVEICAAGGCSATRTVPR